MMVVDEKGVEKRKKSRKIDTLYPIPQERVLLYNERKKGLIIADLHLGIEAEFAKGGVHVRSRTNELLNHILSLVKEHKAEYVIFLGDIKHNIPGTSMQEYMEIPSFFDELLEKTKEVHIVKGNHDGGIERIVPDGVCVHGSDGFVWEGLGLFHGHTWPNEDVMRSKLVLMAHIHPIVKFSDGRYSIVSEPCWLTGKWTTFAKKKNENLDIDGEFADVIVMPAYNEYLSGSAVNEPGRQLIGPVMKNKVFDLDNALVYLLDGTYLGDVCSLTKMLEETQSHKYKDKLPKQLSVHKGVNHKGANVQRVQGIGKGFEEEEV